MRTLVTMSDTRCAPVVVNKDLKEANRMKIDLTHQILKSVYAEQTQKSEGTQANKFGQILDEAIKQPSKVETGARRSPIVNGIPEIQLSPFPGSKSSTIVEGAERLLDTLDEYRQKLGNHEVRLREMDPLINKIDKQTERLTTELDSLPEGDGLREILNQALIASSLEVARFNRGDYAVA